MYEVYFATMYLSNCFLKLIYIRNNISHPKYIIKHKNCYIKELSTCNKILHANDKILTVHCMCVYPCMSICHHLRENVQLIKNKTGWSNSRIAYYLGQNDNMQVGIDKPWISIATRWQYFWFSKTTECKDRAIIRPAISVTARIINIELGEWHLSF